MCQDIGGRCRDHDDGIAAAEVDDGVAACGVDERGIGGAVGPAETSIWSLSLVLKSLMMSAPELAEKTKVSEPEAAEQPVIAHAAVDAVVARIALEDVVEGVAGGVEVGGAGQGQVLDIGP